jgi:hypothetical protein
MLRSFFLRLLLILSTTGTLCLVLMGTTLGLKQDREGMVFFGILAGILLLWVLINLFVVRKTDPELSFEVARLLLPSGAALSLTLSFLLAMVLDEMIPGTEGREHWVLVFAGIGVAIFLGIRSLDMKWLRAEDEIVALEEVNRK